MSDTQPEPADTTAHSTRPAARFNRKPLFLVVFFVLLWLLTAQGIPRLLPQYLPHNAVPPATPAPAAVQSTPQGDESDPRHELAKLKSDYEALRKRVAELEEKQLATPAASNAAPELLDRIATLETRLNSKAAAPPDATILSDLRSRVDASERELAELRATARSAQSADWHKLGMISALHTVQEVAATGHPFQRELDNLRALADGEPAVTDMIDGLNPLATKGVETLEHLRRSFDDAVRAALSQPNHSDNIKDKIAGQLARLVTIRKIGDQAGGGDEAMIARAETKLAQDALEDALKELQALTPATAQAMAPWIARANEKVALQVQIDELKRTVTQTIHRLATETPATP